MDRGWIKLYRKTMDSRVFRNADLFKVWIWCLLKANHQTEWISVKTGRGAIEVQVNPGQFIFGRKTAAKELNMPMSSVRNRMAKLKDLGNLDTKEDTHYTLVSVVNWAPYQSDDEKRTGKWTGKGQPKDTNKNDKNDKKIIYSCDFFSVDEKSHKEYQEAYPNTEPLAEYAKMAVWLKANPSKRKTQRGYPRFITNWLARANSENKETWRDQLQEIH